MEATGLPVVSDLRARDVAAGGQGAPLASTLDVLWLAGPGGPRAALNLGGIANVTVVGDGPALGGFDTGPATACSTRPPHGRPAARSTTTATGGSRAPAASRGRSLRACSRIPTTPRRRRSRPGASTSTAPTWPSGSTAGPDGPDLLATLTELTAATVARALAPFAVTEVVASGGGVRNPALLDALRRRLGATPLTTADERGLDPAAKEAYLMALLGFLTWHGVRACRRASPGPPSRACSAASARATRRCASRAEGLAPPAHRALTCAAVRAPACREAP